MISNFIPKVWTTGLITTIGSGTKLKTFYRRHFEISFVLRYKLHRYQGQIYMHIVLRHSVSGVSSRKNTVTIQISLFRADSGLAPSKWETSLQSNAASRWLGANLESTLLYFKTDRVAETRTRKHIIITYKPLWLYHGLLFAPSKRRCLY